MTDAKSVITLLACVDSDETLTTDALLGEATTNISFLASAITIALLTRLLWSVSKSWSVPEPLSVLVEPTIKKEALNNSLSLKCFSQAAIFCDAVGCLPFCPPDSELFSGNVGLLNAELTACASVLVSFALDNIAVE